MTPDDTKFSHITVNSDEDEVVIHAGIRASKAGEEEEAPAKSAAEPAAAAAAPAAAAAEPAADEPAAATEPTPAEPESADIKHEYHETTADDLKAQPMPTAQKIVLALAAVLIVGFVVYYIVLR